MVDLYVYGDDEESQWEVKNIRGLHRPQQSMVKRQLLFTKDRHVRDFMSRFRFLTLLDVSLGYHQISKQSKDDEKTSFITDKQTFCYKAMVFGFRNARATYQKKVIRVFKD